MERETHGHSQTRLYRIWSGMKQRCENPRHAAFKNYGAKGVTVCARWRESFKAFWAWSLFHGYQDDLTLDRIDPFGNYEPDNCRWVTYRAQAANKRGTKRKERLKFDFSELKGLIVREYETFCPFCDALGMTVTELSERLDNLVEFDAFEIVRICELLAIPRDQIPAYFFTFK